ELGRPAPPHGERLEKAVDDEAARGRSTAPAGLSRCPSCRSRAELPLSVNYSFVDRIRPAPHHARRARRIRAPSRVSRANTTLSPSITRPVGGGAPSRRSTGSSAVAGEPKGPTARIV